MIIILGIISVLALPKFINVNDSAQIAKVSSIAAAFKQGINNVQLKWEMDGKPQNVSNRIGPSVFYGNKFVTVDEDTGLPVGEAGRDRSININTNQDCSTIFTDVLTNEISVTRRRNNEANRLDYDFVATRFDDNTNGDSCNYFLVESIPEDDEDPNNDVLPEQYIGFSYNAETGLVNTFYF